MDEKTFNAEYPALAHALQSGVQATIELNQNEVAHNRVSSRSISTSPKMLRTGVNMAMVEQSAMMKLLVEKGVLTWEEVWQALIDGLRAEIDRYEKELTERIGRPVTLG